MCETLRPFPKILTYPEWNAYLSKRSLIKLTLSGRNNNNNRELKCTIIPIVIGATGIVTRSLRKNLEAVPGKRSIDSLQKTAILGTSHIIRKVLQCEA
jgi:hypothetical protein